MFDSILPDEIFHFFLVFARLGAALMLFPGLGETYVPPRIRLLAAFAVTVAVVPLVSGQLPALPEDFATIGLLVASEVVIGLFFGALIRMMISALHTAGVIIAFQGGLAAAQVFDPNQAQGGTLPGNLLSALGVVLIFATGLYQPMFWALIDSYHLFTPGAPPPVDDFVQMAVRVMSGAFVIALQIAAPIMLVGLLFYVSIGLIARMIPQMQVFFIALPIQIVLGLYVLAVTLSAGMLWYLDHFEASISQFLRY